MEAALAVLLDQAPRQDVEARVRLLLQWVAALPAPLRAQMQRSVGPGAVDPAPPFGQAGVRIRTLGRFEIELDGRPLRFAGKAQLRPLDLLKALVALGGRAVPVNRLIEVVWSDASQAADHKTLDVTLFRLRRLLGNDQSVLVSNRRVSLNSEIVWIDLWALDDQFARIDPLCGAGPCGCTEFEQAAAEILALYGGSFLNDDPDAEWLAPVRERVRSRFRRCVMRMGDHWESRCEWQRAAALYEHAIGLEPLSESFYCRAMVCLREQGRRSEALDVYWRLRRVLSVTRGVAPTEQAAALFDDVARPGCGTGSH